MTGKEETIRTATCEVCEYITRSATVVAFAYVVLNIVWHLIADICR